MNNEKIKFYVSPSLKISGMQHIPLLFPFWGVPSMENSPFNEKLFTENSFDTNQYDIVEDIENSDFVLIPYRYTTLKGKCQWFVDQYIKEARAKHKPILIDGTGDIEYPIEADDIYVLRIGGYRFKKDKNRIQIPPFGEDLLEEYCGGKLDIRSKSDIPTVGFAGWASLSIKQRLRNFIKEMPHRLLSIFNSNYGACKKGVVFREKTIKYLRKSKKIKTNILARTSFSSNIKTAEKDVHELRKEFIKVINDSDYGLTVRGDANAAIRLFEVLSMGRIPLIVDTECILPLSDEVDYRKFSMFVDFRDLSNIADRVREFNDNISDEEFKAMQKRAREAFERYFRIDVFTEHLMNILRDKKKEYEKRK